MHMHMCTSKHTCSYVCMHRCTHAHTHPYTFTTFFTCPVPLYRYALPCVAISTQTYTGYCDSYLRLPYILTRKSHTSRVNFICTITRAHLLRENARLYTCVSGFQTPRGGWRILPCVSTRVSTCAQTCVQTCLWTIGLARQPCLCTCTDMSARLRIQMSRCRYEELHARMMDPSDRLLPKRFLIFGQLWRWINGAEASCFGQFLTVN